MSAIDDTKRKVVAQFHEIFGGENATVDHPHEIPQLAAKAYSEVEPYIQKAILESLLQIDGDGGKFALFQNDLVLKLCNEFLGLGTMEAQRAVQSLFYFLEGKYGGELPSFVKLAGKKASGGKHSDDIKTIFLFVNKNGHRLPVIIDEAMLDDYGDIDIDVDGAVDSVAIVAAAGTKIMTKGRQWPARPKEDLITEKFNSRFLNLGDMKNPTPVQISPFTWPASLQVLFSDEEIGKFDYFFSGDFHNDIKLKDEQPQVAFRGKSAVCQINNRKIVVHQTPPVKLSEIGFDEEKGDAQYLYYGDAKHVMDDNRFKDGIKGISEGLRFAEDGIGVLPVKSVEVYPAHYDYIGVRFSHGGGIIFSTQSVLHENMAELKVAAAHEAIHLFAFAERFADEPEMAAYYDLLLDSGDTFFDFIKESNFYDTWEVGHPKDSINEFLASFIHTLLDVDRLEIKLTNLPDEERESVLDHYTDLIGMLRMTAKSDDARNFFELAGDRLDGIRCAYSFMNGGSF